MTGIEHGIGHGIAHVEIAAGAWQLRPPTADEAEDALAMLHDPLNLAYNEAPTVVDLDTARAWCVNLADWSTGTHATFSVLDATTGRLAGNVSLHRIDAVQHEAYVGYRTAPWARGQGLATTALGAVTRWAFGALAIERIELLHTPGNDASCRVAVKVGYVVEGTRRGSYRLDDGTREDEHVHSRLATDPEP